LSIHISIKLEMNRYNFQGSGYNSRSVDEASVGSMGLPAERGQFWRRGYSSRRINPIANACSETVHLPELQEIAETLL
jgi:hypothetical protein